MSRMVAKERAEAGSGSWDQVACLGNTDSGDSTKVWITRGGGGGGAKGEYQKRSNKSFFLAYPMTSIF